MAATVKKLCTIYDSPGTSQLKEFFGKPQIGDVCQVHLIGHVIDPTAKGFCCIPPNTEFIDTNHMLKRATIEIGRKGYDGLYRGIHEALLDMKFGDEVKFFIPSELAFGKQGLSMATVDSKNPDHENRNPVPVSFIPIGPDTDLEVLVIFFRICRDGKWHNRHIANRPNALNSGYHGGAM